MLPFGGNWDEDPREFLNWFFQCMGTTSDNNKVRSFRYYIQADSDADEWFEELPQQEKLDWALVEALFRKKWLKEEVMGITETATDENEPQPVPTTCQSIPPPSEPITTLRTTPDTSDTSKGDNERNASHYVTTTSPPATTTNFDLKPSLSISPDPDASPTTSNDLTLAFNSPPSQDSGRTTSLVNTTEPIFPTTREPEKSTANFEISCKTIEKTNKINNQTGASIKMNLFDENQLFSLNPPHTPPDEPISPEPPPSTSAQHSSIFSLDFSFVFDLVWHPFVFHIQIP